MLCESMMFLVKMLLSLESLRPDEASKGRRKIDSVPADPYAVPVPPTEFEKNVEKAEETGGCDRPRG
jgi:hypothetical protein